MGCGCKKRKHPIQQQPTPSTIRLTEVTKKENNPISEDENKIIQQIVEEVKKLHEQS